jgi:hypothetical protein
VKAVSRERSENFVALVILRGRALVCLRVGLVPVALAVSCQQAAHSVFYRAHVWATAELLPAAAMRVICYISCK